MFNTKKTSNHKKTLGIKPSIRLLACLLVAIMCVSALAACGGEETTENQSTEESALAIKTTYSVRVKSSTGKALSGLDVHV